MADTIRDTFFASLEAGAKWDVGVVINRTNGLPLDLNSVFKSQEALDTYVNDVLAYPGQVVALVKENETIMYYIDQNKQLQEIGANLTADGNSVVIDDNGKISLANLPTDGKTYNAVFANGKLTWVEPSATTVEGLDTRLSAAEGAIEDLNEQVAELGKAFEFKGEADSYNNDTGKLYKDDVEIIGSIGDVYQVGDKEYAWNGTAWIELGFNIDLSGYATKTELAETDTKATNAGTAAATAQTTADEAKTAAGNAATAASNAQTTANQAVTDAATASEKAQTGINNAATAQAAAEAAQNTANEAKNAASTNAQAISGLQTLTNGHAGALTEHAGRIQAVETETAKIAGIQEAINKNTGDLSGLTTKVVGIEGTVTAHATSLAEIITKNTEQDTAIANVKATADAAATGAALTAEINRATAAEEANAAAIKAISDDYLKSADKTALTDLINAKADTTALEAEVDRATKKEAELAGAIAGNTAVINSILGNEDEIDLNSIAELASWITEHGKDAEGMVTAIEKNAEDIAANTKKIGEVEASIPGALTAALADYKIKNVDNTTLQVSNEGVTSIKAVSTDLLTQGVNELILVGGNASK